MATLRQVAARAQVSLSTASRVLSGSPSVDADLRRRVLSAAADLDYNPQPVIFSGRGTVIATVISASLARGMERFPTTAETILGIARRCKEKNMENTMLFLGGETSPRQLCFDGVDAYIFTGTGDEESRALISCLRAAKKAVVLVGRHSDEDGVSTVGTDETQMLRDAVSCLVNAGHTRIGYLRGVNSRSLAEKRLEGFRMAMAEFHLPVEDEWLYTGTFDEASGQRGAEAYLTARTKPTGLVADSDQIAMGFVRRLADAGISVPEDVSVVGMDDVGPAAFSVPPLTTVRMEYGRTGAEAVDIAAAMLRTGGTMKYQVTVRHTLMERGTVAPPKVKTN